MKTRKKCMYSLLLLVVLCTGLWISTPKLTYDEAVVLKNLYCEIHELDPDDYYVSPCWDGKTWDFIKKGAL